MTTEPSNMPRADYVAACIAGFPFAEKQQTMVKRAQTERGPITFLALCRSIRIGHAVSKGLSPDSALSFFSQIEGVAIPKDAFASDPVLLTDLCWHRIMETWITIDELADSWIPPMASSRQLGLLMGLAKKSGDTFDYLNMTADEASAIISSLKKNA